MSFQPVLPLGGLAGWRLLERTEATQRAAFDRSPQIERDLAAFTERIGTVRSAEALVADRALFRVALGAFGLDEELSKTYFMRRMLEEGTDDPQSLANRFVDPRYADFSRAFGFGDLGGPWTGLPGFAERIADAYRVRQFEIAVGAQNPDMRLALSFRRDIGTFAESPTSDGAAWFRVLGSRPLRAVFEAAYGLPKEFATLDLDRQRDMMRDKTRDAFGDSSLAAFRDPANVQTLIDRFLVRRQIETGASGPGVPGSGALQLLQGGGGGLAASARINLILSGA